jgi:hypothetical protein
VPLPRAISADRPAPFLRVALLKVVRRGPQAAATGRQSLHESTHRVNDSVDRCGYGQFQTEPVPARRKVCILPTTEYNQLSLNLRNSLHRKLLDISSLILTLSWSNEVSRYLTCRGFYGYAHASQHWESPSCLLSLVRSQDGLQLLLRQNPNG